MRKALIKTGLFCATLVFAFACTKIKPVPPAQTTFNTVLVQEPSVLTLPISFDLGKIESIINEKLQGTFLRKKIPANHNDSLVFELTTLKPMVMSWHAPDLRSTVDIRVSGHYIKRILGLTIQNKTPIDFEVRISLKTELGFEPDWGIRPKTTIENIGWQKDPELRIGMIVINIRGMVEKALTDNEEGLTDLLDGFIRQEVDTRKVIGNIWASIQKPIRIKKEVPRIWLLVDADSLKARWTRSPEREIIVQAQIIGRVRTVLEGEKLKPEPKELPAFSFRAGTEDSLYANVLCVLPFNLTNKYLREQLVGTSFDSAGYKAKIKSIEVYGTDQGLAVKVGMGGDTRGNLYFRGTPVIDRATKSFRVKDFDFDVDTENSLLSTADWLLHTSLKNTIESQLVFDLQSYVEMLPTLIERGIEKGKLGEKLQVSIQSWEVIPMRTAITSENIQMIVRVTGLAGIELKTIQKDSTQARMTSN